MSRTPVRLASADAAAERLGRGLLAGLVGTAAMTVSSTAEMLLRGRPPSRAPLEVAEKLLDVRTRGEGTRLATAGHLITGVANAGIVALLGRPTDARLFGSAMVPELVLVPALTDVPPPWRWGLGETAISVAHHAVYALATARAYRALEGARPHPTVAS